MKDFIQRDLASPIWRTVLHAVWIYLRLNLSGTLARDALKLCYLEAKSIASGKPVKVQ